MIIFSQFRTFAQQNLSNNNNIENYIFDKSLEYINERGSLTSGEEPLSHENGSELAMLNIIRNTGLIIAKQKGNKSWKILERPNSNQPTLTQTKCK